MEYVKIKAIDVKFLKNNKGIIKTKSLILILSEYPKDFIKNPSDFDIYRIFPSVLEEKYKPSSVLKYGHDFPYNKGVIQYKFKEKIKLKIKDMNLFKRKSGIECDDITEINNNKVTSLIKELNKLGKFKIIVDYFDKKLIDIPKFIQEFIDTYIAMGGFTDNKYGKNWKKVKEWYQKNKTLKIPKYVWRGIDKPIKTKKYKHPFKYPISTSLSKKIALDYGNCIKLKISPENVVLDTRIVKTDHDAQSEIILDPTISYDIIKSF